MEDLKKNNPAYEFLNSKQKQVATNVEKLLIGFTVSEAKELLHAIRKSIEKTKII